MIRRLLLSTVALAALTTIAAAADLPARRAPPVYVPPPIPVFSWTGAYVGVNAGYTFDDENNFFFDGRPRGVQTGRLATNFQNKGNGFTGGGQIGYNYELGGAGSVIPGFGAEGGGLVIGVEADAAYLDDKTNGSFVANSGAVTNFRSRDNYLGTVRGRLGAAFGPLLVYGTGGFAYGSITNVVQARGAGVGFVQGSGTQTGYAAGGGLEYALPTATFLNVFNSSAITVKVEYLHFDLGDQNLAGSGLAGRVRNEGNLVRAGLNYKLGFAPAPVVARY